jgi:uncharacterized membrane protein HdeD (DUF308 family)
LVGLAIAIGCILAIVGIVYGALTISKKERDLIFALRIFFSAICIIAGVVTAAFNDGAVEIIVAISSLLLIIDASFKLHTTAMSKRYSLPLWWIILSISVLVIIGAFILIKYTPKKIETTSILLGIIFIADAISNLLSAFFISAYENRLHDDILSDPLIAKESKLRAQKAELKADRAAEKELKRKEKEAKREIKEEEKKAKKAAKQENGETK